MSNLISTVKSKKIIDKIPLERNNDPKILQDYLTDEAKIIIGKAEEVVFPRNEKQISDLILESIKSKNRVTVSGAGTGITGSRVPLGGIVMSLEKMTLLSYKPETEKLIEHSELGKKFSICIGKDEKVGDYYAISPAGIPLEIFKKIIQNEGLYYPLDPTETTALLGGTVATNASGARTFNYGPTRDYVRRLRIVLPNGEVLDIKRGEVFSEKNQFIIVLGNGEEIRFELPTYKMPDVEKNAAGFYIKPEMDLIDLFIGSEGILGVISEIEVKLIDKPKKTLPIFAHFSDEKHALKAVKLLRELTRSGKVKILLMEFFDKNSTAFIREKYPPPKIPEKSNGIIFFEQEAPSEEELFSALEETLMVLEKANVLDTAASAESDWEQEVKEMRHALPEGVNSFVRTRGTHKVATDIAVKEDKFDDLMQFYHEIGNKTGIPYVIFGHIGNYHVHFNFLPTNKDELKIALKTLTTFLRKSIELGGTISGEHGVGKKHYIEENGDAKPYLEIMYGKKGINEIVNMKLKLDPNYLLNTGTIVPIEYLKDLKEKTNL